VDNFNFQLELATFDEKIALAELEEARSAERTKEFRYEKSRFILHSLNITAQKNRDRASASTEQQSVPSQIPETKLKTPVQPPQPGPQPVTRI
jgi:hypothetical protein